MTDQKLTALPCPFCGHKADLDDDDTLYPSGIYWRETDGIRHYILLRNRQDGDGQVWGMHCPEVAGGCGAEIDGDTKEEALEKWNRRVPSA